MQRYLLSIAATLLLILIILVGAVPLLDWYEYERYHAAIADNRFRWQENFVDSYAFTIQMHCQCDAPGNIPFRVTNVDSRTVSIVSVDSGESFLATGTREVPHSIRGVFDKLVEIVERRPDALSVTFDESFGYPSHIEVDFDQDFNNDDVSYEIVDFEVLRNDL